MTTITMPPIPPAPAPAPAPRALITPAPNTPELEEVYAHARGADQDRDDLNDRVARIYLEAKDLAAEALRVRDENRATIDNMKAAGFWPTSPPVAADAPSVSVMLPGLTTSVAILSTPAPAPASLVAWAKHTAGLTPIAPDNGVVIPELVVGGVVRHPAITLGDLRAWLLAQP